MQNQPGRYQDTDTIPQHNPPIPTYPDPRNETRVTPKITLPQIVMAPESSGENVKGTSADLVQLLSQESANALVCEEKQPLAWRCEFDINLTESLEVVNPAT